MIYFCYDLIASDLVRPALDSFSPEMMSVVSSYLECIVIVLYSCSNISALVRRHSSRRAVATSDSTSLTYVESERSIIAYLNSVFSPDRLYWLHDLFSIFFPLIYFVI